MKHAHRPIEVIAKELFAAQARPVNDVTARMVSNRANERGLYVYRMNGCDWPLIVTVEQWQQMEAGEIVPVRANGAGWYSIPRSEYEAKKAAGQMFVGRFRR